MKPNIILIVCCSLRKDLGKGFGNAKTPNLDRLAREGVAYENCIAPGTWTFPSHVSILTGMYPSQHGVHEKLGNEEQVAFCRKANVALSAPRLGEQLEAKGYKTIFIGNNIMLHESNGFKYGFQDFIVQNASPWIESQIAMEARRLGADPMQVLKKLIGTGRIKDIPKFARELMRIKRIAKKINYPIDKGASKTAAMLRSLDLKPGFFLFIGLFDMHEPYPNFTDRDAEDVLAGVRPINQNTLLKLKKDYVKEMEHLDRQLGAVFEMLKKSGLYSNSMIIVTSDHGQAFNEHGFMYHGVYLYDEIVRVPLIIKYPKGKKFKKREGYQSLANLPRLVGSILRGRDDRPLTTRSAFSESYGIIDTFPDTYASRMPYIKSVHEKARAAIYMDGYKLNVNGSDGVIEEFMKGSKDVDPRGHRAAYEKLARELRRFKNREGHFSVPKVSA